MLKILQNKEYNDYRKDEKEFNLQLRAAAQEDAEKQQKEHGDDFDSIAASGPPTSSAVPRAKSNGKDKLPGQKD